jgi:hypothetical protein
MILWWNVLMDIWGLQVIFNNLLVLYLRERFGLLAFHGGL